jgi:hypothetical protein
VTNLVRHRFSVIDTYPHANNVLCYHFGMKSRWIWLLLIGLICLSAAASSIRYFYLQDYEVHAYVECDPSTESCFAGDGEFTPIYYKEVIRPAYTIPACDIWEGECQPLTCSDGNPRCRTILCDPSIEECAIAEEENGDE